MEYYVLRNGEYLVVKSIQPGDVIVPVRLDDNSEWNGTEWVINLDALKKQKIESLSADCHIRILNNFTSRAYNGELKRYDCDYTDQARISGLVAVAQTVLMGLADESIGWKAKGELECYPWTPQQMIQLGLDVKRHIEKETGLFYEKRIKVINAKTVAEILAIE